MLVADTIVTPANTAKEMIAPKEIAKTKTFLMVRLQSLGRIYI